MKKQFTPPLTKFTLKLILMTFALFLLINSCKKQLWVPEAPSEALVAKAKSFYAQQVMRIELKDRQVMGTKVQKSKTTKRKTPVPIWDNAVLETTTGGKTLLTVPMAKYQLNNEDIDYARKFVFSERGGEIVDGGIVEVYGPKAFIADKGDGMIARKGGKQIEGFTGLIIEYDLNYGYRDGKYYRDGVVKKGSAYVGTKRPDITQKQAPKKSSIRSTATVAEDPDANLANKPAQKISSFVPIFEDGQNCDYYYRVYIERDEYGAITYWENLGFAYSICVATEDPNQPGGITEYFIDCAGVINGSASSINDCNTCMGGTTGITECPPPIDTVMNVQDSCLRVLIANVLNSSIKSDFRSLMNQWVIGNSELIITFQDGSFGPGSDLAGAMSRLSPFQLNGNDYLKGTLLLNSDYLNGASNEYKTVVIYHEILHAYILQLGGLYNPSSVQHEAMASTFRNMLISALEANGVDTSDASALAWFGLQGTGMWELCPNKNGVLSTMQSYMKGGNKGTKCQ